MNCKVAISIIENIREDYTPRESFQEENEAFDLVIKALEYMEQIKEAENE